MLGAKYAVSVANGTLALESALQALDIGAGHEVITTSRTFIASASCALVRGARVACADVDADSQNITAETIRRVITPKTKAIIAVHLAGWPCDMDSIMAIAAEFKLQVIEDCAQAHGATYKGAQVGSIGHMAAFSFCQDKIMTTGGEGGMVTTNNEELWQRAWSYKDHGKSYDAVYRNQHPPGFRWLHESFGTNWRLTEMQSALGRIMLRKLTAWVATRRRNAVRLTDCFRKIPALRVTEPPSALAHSYYKYYVFVRPERLRQGWTRDRIIAEINERRCAVLFRELQRDLPRKGISRKNAPEAAASGVAHTRPDQSDVPHSPHLGSETYRSDLHDRGNSDEKRNPLSKIAHSDRGPGVQLLCVTREIKLEIIARVVADLIILNASLFIGLLPQLLLQHSRDFSYFDKWWPSACLLSAAGPLLFYCMGFYTKGRFYAGKYKAVILTQAASLLFLGLDALPVFLSSAALVPKVLSAPGLGRNHRVPAGGSSVVGNLAPCRHPREPPRQHIGDAGPRSVLVIGGAGYIGSALIPKLLDQGYKVRLLDFFLYGQDPIKPFMQHPNLELHRGDFRNVDTVVAAMRNMDSVVHLGAIVGDPACALDEELTIQINLIATRMIAQVAKGNGISRFVFASSCSVYGASDELLNEKSLLNPVSLYARSKIASENVLMSFRGDHFEPVILRFGTIYGLSGRTRFDLVVNLLTAKALVEKVVTVFGKDQWRPFLHVHDASRSILASLDAASQAVSPAIFNVGCDEQNRTLGQIGHLITTMVPGSVLRCSEENADRRNYRVEFKRIREGLGFPVQSGPSKQECSRFWTQCAAERYSDYQDAMYSNVKFLSAPHVRMHLPVMEDWVAESLSQSGEALAAHA